MLQLGCGMQFRSYARPTEKMIHVLLRILVWVVVLGVGFLVFGPQLFDSSETANPFGRSQTLFLPPAKQQREIEFEKLARQGALSPEERVEYEALVKSRRSSFWKGRDASVEEALSGVKTQRGAYLVNLLEQRGWSRDEAVMFLTMVRRDHPDLLADRD